MDLFIARQPVFDRHQHVYGYELLYRKTRENRFLADTDSDEASANVIINGFNVLGIEKLTDGKRAFVNFTGPLLQKGVATLFPKEILLVEILESVEPTFEIVEACRVLKQKGYMISLDDYVDDPKYKPLVELSEIVMQDVALSYKLLRLVNSSAFGLISKIESVRQALVMLGMTELRKWLSLFILCHLS